MSEEDKAQAPAPTPDAFASLTKFRVKPTSDEPGVSKEIQKDIDRVAKDNGFVSRQAAKPEKRQRWNSAGPRKQLNLKIPTEMYDQFYRLAEEGGYKALYQLLGASLNALEASLKEKKE